MIVSFENVDSKANKLTYYACTLKFGCSLAIQGLEAFLVIVLSHHVYFISILFILTTAGLFQISFKSDFNYINANISNQVSSIFMTGP